MYFTSYLANKCFAYLLSCDSEKDNKHHLASRQITSQISLPPWAHEPNFFKSICDGCGACLASCENKILIPDSDGYPQIDFSLGSCNFCGACAESCPNGAFNYEPSQSPWKLQAFITKDCLSHNNVLCRTCAEHCEEEAIIIPKKNGIISAPRILAESCTGCGACYSPCPAKAIEMSESGGQEKTPTREEIG